jgi:hypothetical protein
MGDEQADFRTSDSAGAETAEQASLEERFCASCGGGNPLVALHCMWCGRQLAAPAAAPGRGETARYTAPLRYSMATRVEAGPLSQGRYRVLRAAGLGLIVIGALLSLGFALVAIYGLATPEYGPHYRTDTATHAGLAALGMTGLLVACMLLILPGYILTKLVRANDA